jgi:hypothetical protein
MMFCVLPRLAYLTVTNARAALRLLPMSDRDKDVEILVLVTSLPFCRGSWVRLGRRSPVRTGRSWPRY